MIETVEDAAYEAQVMVQEHGDSGDFDVDMSMADAIVSVVLMYQLEDSVALELCRRELGFVPYELRSRLGDHDWVQ